MKKNMNLGKLTVLIFGICGVCSATASQEIKMSLENELYRKFDSLGSFTATYLCESLGATNEVALTYNAKGRQIQMSVRDVYGASKGTVIAVFSEMDKTSFLIEMPNDGALIWASDDSRLFDSSSSFYMFIDIYSLFREKSLGEFDTRFSSGVTIGIVDSKVQTSLETFLLFDKPLKLSWLEKLSSIDPRQITRNNNSIDITLDGGRQISINLMNGLLVSDVQKGGIPNIQLIRVEQKPIEFDAVMSEISAKAKPFPDGALLATEISILQQINQSIPVDAVHEFINQNEDYIRYRMHNIGRSNYQNELSRNKELAQYIEVTAKTFKTDGLQLEQWELARPKWVSAIQKNYLQSERSIIDEYMKEVPLSENSLNEIAEFCLPLIMESYALEIVKAIECKAGLVKGVAH